MTEKDWRSRVKKLLPETVAKFPLGIQADGFMMGWCAMLTFMALIQHRWLVASIGLAATWLFAILAVAFRAVLSESMKR
jgi:hypothetical protein